MSTDRLSCPSCQLVRINGVVTHERGFPDSWRFTTRECKECGTRFEPESRDHVCCDMECTEAYFGVAREAF